MHSNTDLSLQAARTLDASLPIGVFGAGDGRHRGHVGPRLLQVAAGDEWSRIDPELLLPLVLEGLRLG